jgi:alkylhydroperoxidase family enzyme
MRIPNWTAEARPQAPDLVEAIKARRGGELINLDRALLWSEPLARGWNVYLKAVRTELGASRKLRELGICTVALLTGAAYEYHHHAPDFMAAGGMQAELDLLNAWLKADARGPVPAGQALWPASAIEPIVVQFAAQMTLDVVVTDATFKALSAQLSTVEVVELTAAIATYNMVARFLVALDVNIER